MKSLWLLFFLFCNDLLFAQWIQTKGPVGSSIDAEEYANDSIYSYFRNSNGLFRTADEGETWTHLENGLPEYYVAIGFCVSKEEIFLSYYNNLTRRTGFAYSKDRGDHWVERPLPYFDWFTYEFAYLNGILIAKGTDELIESIDLGISWHSSGFGKRLINFTHIKANKTTFYVSDQQKVYRRFANDTSWNLVLNILDPDYFEVLHVSDSSLLVIKNNKPGLVSLDNGQTWSSMNLNYSAYLQERVVDFGDRLYFGNSDHFFKSLDKGLTWKELNLFKKDSFQFQYPMRLGKYLLITDVRKGLIKTPDEFKSFETAADGIYSDRTSNLIVTDSFVIALRGKSLFRYDIANQKWSNHAILTEEHISALRYHNRVLYVLTYDDNKLYTSKDEGSTFEEIGLDSFPILFNATHFFGFDNKMILVGNGVKKYSEDQGKTWKDLLVRDSKGRDLNSYDYFVDNQKLWVILYDPANSYRYLLSSVDLIKWDFVKTITSGQYLVYFYSLGHNLFMREFSDGQCSVLKFDTLTNDFKLTSGLETICSCKILAKNGTLIAFTSTGYYLSFDEGLNWTKVFDEWANSNIGYLNDLVFQDQTLYASCDYIGVLKSDWNSLKTGLVKAFVFYDMNSNGIYDNGDQPMKGAYLNLKKQEKYLRTDDLGKITFNYSSALIDTMKPLFFNSEGSFKPSSFAFSPGDTTLQFAYQFLSPKDDISVKLISLNSARSGYDYFLDIIYKNQGTHSCSGKIVFNFDPNFSYLQSSLLPDLKLNNLLSWSFNDLSILEERKIHVVLHVTDSILLNYAYSHSVVLMDLSCVDQDLSNNADELKDHVLLMDSNAEMMVDREVISRQELNDGLPLTYTIRFQNPCDQKTDKLNLRNDLYGFDLYTFKVISSSHPFSFQIAPDKILNVCFDSIQLSDSLSNELNSYVYFKYSVVHYPDADIWFNEIVNRAYFEFNINLGISTNNVVTKIADLVHANELTPQNKEDVLIVPNPNSGKFRIFSTYLQNKSLDQLSIFDLNGQCVLNRKDQITNGYLLDLEELPAGMYILKLGKSKSLVGKISIQN